jgi:hypothetical protein
VNGCERLDYWYFTAISNPFFRAQWLTEDLAIMYNNRGRTLVMKTTAALNHFTLTMLTHHWKSEIIRSKLKCESLLQKPYTFLISSKYWHTLSFMAWWFT